MIRGVDMQHLKVTQCTKISGGYRKVWMNEDGTITHNRMPMIDNYPSPYDQFADGCLLIWAQITGATVLEVW